MDPSRSPRNLTTWLQDGGVKLLDGGMGQELLHRGLAPGDKALWSAQALREAPELVQEVHAAYLEAGADIITTNTYATSRRTLKQAELGDAFEALNRTAGRLANAAREDAEREDVLIAGSLPPYGTTYQPNTDVDARTMRTAFRAQAQVLAPHVDFFLCETLASVDEARAAAEGAASTGTPAVVSWTLRPEVPDDESIGLLPDGTTLSDAIDAVEDVTRSIFVNCCPPEVVTAALPRMVEATDLPVGGYANGFSDFPDDWHYDGPASLPESRDDLGPSKYAAHASRWIEAGAQVVGGCCEIGPDHIQYLRRLLNASPEYSG
jgi:S-methylmethionine-dependent homocysteine/selenocysteine methylase